MIYFENFVVMRGDVDAWSVKLEEVSLHFRVLAAGYPHEAQVCF